MRKISLIIIFLLIASTCFAQHISIARDKIIPVDAHSYKVELGEEKDEVTMSTIGIPEVTFNRWNKECYMKIGSPILTGVKRFENGKIKYGNSAIELRWYDKSDDSFEYEIILKKKPLSNTITLPITSRGLNYYYQPALKNVMRSGDTWEGGTKKEPHDFRPVDIVGSYAVYHATKRFNEYSTGKAFHIPRAFAYDAGNNSTWCEYNTDLNRTHNLSITLPWEFINNSTYPITIDPEIGYGTSGNSTSGFENGMTALYADIGGDAGTADNITLRVRSSTAAKEVKCALYNTSTNATVATASAVSVPGDSTFAWRIWTLGSESLAAGQNVTITTWGDLGSGTLLYRYDTGAANVGRFETGVTYTAPDPAFPNPWNTWTTSNRLVSITLNYTVSGGPTGPKKGAVMVIN